MIAIKPIAEPELVSLVPRHEMIEFCGGMSVRMWAGYIDNELICVWGLIPPSLLSNQAYLWMHSTEFVEGHTFLFVRYSQLVVGEMLKHYECIVGHVRTGAVRSKRWLHWLGATFGPTEGGITPFVIRRKASNG